MVIMLMIMAVIMIVVMLVIIVMIMVVMVIVAGTMIVPRVFVRIRDRCRRRGIAAGTRLEDFGLVAEAFDLADDAFKVDTKSVADGHCPRHHRNRDVFNPIDAARGSVDFGGAAGAVHSVNPEARIHAGVGHADAPCLCLDHPYNL